MCQITVLCITNALHKAEEKEMKTSEEEERCYCSEILVRFFLIILASLTRGGLSQ